MTSTCMTSQPRYEFVLSSINGRLTPRSSSMIPRQRYPRHRKQKEAVVGARSPLHLVDRVPGLIRDISLRCLVAKIVQCIHMPQDMIETAPRRLALKMDQITDRVPSGLHGVLRIAGRTMTLVTNLLE